MFESTLELMPWWAFAAAALVTFAAGFVKGSVGFAMPLIMISGLALFLEPTLVIAGIVLPIVMSNFLQVARYGRVEARSAIVEHWRYIAIVCLMILVVAQFVTVIPGHVMYLILGVVVVALSVIQLSGVRFHIAPAHRRRAEWGTALLAGGLGGLAGTWGPPTVLYLIALDTPKKRQMLVQGWAAADAHTYAVQDIEIQIAADGRSAEVSDTTVETMRVQGQTVASRTRERFTVQMVGGKARVTRLVGHVQM